GQSGLGPDHEGVWPDDPGGGASRFFYVTKPPTAEKNRGSSHFNNHPTVKPVHFMRYLIRLITPPGGIVLDCFNGSGTTGVAALSEGMHYLGIEGDPKDGQRYCEISRSRIKAVRTGFSPFPKQREFTSLLQTIEKGSRHRIKV